MAAVGQAATQQTRDQTRELASEEGVSVSWWVSGTVTLIQLSKRIKQITFEKLHIWKKKERKKICVTFMASPHWHLKSSITFSRKSNNFLPVTILKSSENESGWRLSFHPYWCECRLLLDTACLSPTWLFGAIEDASDTVCTGKAATCTCIWKKQGVVGRKKPTSEPQKSYQPSRFSRNGRECRISNSLCIQWFTDALAAILSQFPCTLKCIIRG